MVEPELMSDGRSSKERRRPDTHAENHRERFDSSHCSNTSQRQLIITQHRTAMRGALTRHRLEVADGDKGRAAHCRGKRSQLHKVE